MPDKFRQRFLQEAGERPYAWAVSLGLPKDLVTAVLRGSDDYQPIRRTLDKLAQATGKSVQWWQTGEDSMGPIALEPTQPGPPVAGVIAAGSNQVDVRKLELAIRAVDEWEASRQMTLNPERRPAVIAVLYEFLVKSNNQEDAVDVVLRALG